MRSCGRRQTAAAACAVLAVSAAGLVAQPSNPEALYVEALARETALRQEIDVAVPAVGTPLLLRVRTLIGAYQDISRLFRASEIADDALWQAARLSDEAFRARGDATDRDTALRLYRRLAAGFPASPFVRQAEPHVARLSAAVPATAVSPASPPPRATAPVGAPSMPAPSRASSPTATPAVLTAIRRETLPDALRFVFELEREATFSAERLDGPPRVFIDLSRTRAAETLTNAVLPFPEGAVRQIRVGRQADRTRVVLDLRGEAGRHSVYVLYNPYRVVVDFERLAAGIATTHAPARAVVVSAPAAETVHVIPAAGDATTAITTAVRAATAVPAAVTAPPARSAPVPSGPPAANVSGGFSLARQLGLGISKVVIDPGHGGHDPGAKVRGLTEAELVLDVALRLERLLEDQSGIEVVLTRRTNVYVSLEERTAIANRASADLFLSIHVNASKNARASGVESYVLNFAPNATARAVAARENASSARQMRHLPDLVRALALNNKRDESRDLAASLQTALYRQLRRSNRDVRDLGVKQAPFMVLLGATMPSALTEISFITNRDEAARLRTDAYRQLLADGLHAGLLRYQQSVKRPPAIATR